MLSRRRFLTLLSASASALGSEALLGCSEEALSPVPAAFDYIIIGAGSAGCTVAARLLSDPEVTVLLLEAGGENDRSEVRDFTLAWKLTLPGSDVDWGFKSQPQSSLRDKPQSYSAGKLLGGSSSINGMVWVRGNRADYEGWAVAGCIGWDYASVLDSFKSMETYLKGDPAYHGTAGPIRPSDELSARFALSRAVIDAARALGYPLNEDYNGKSQEGVAYTQLNVVDGIRQDAFTAFVKQSLGKPNLTVLTGAWAKRILFDGDKKVDRVLIDKAGVEVAFKARREVILCTGVVNTPQLLMLSGIGAPLELSEFGIPIVSASPDVGKNLQDQLISVVAKKLKKPEPPEHTSTMDVSLFTGGTPGCAPRFQVQSYYMRNGWGAYPPEALALGSIHLHPTSRGTVRLASADFHDAPIIDPNFLGTPEDVAGQLEGYKMIRTLLNAPGLSAWLEDIEAVPGPDVVTDDQLLDAIRTYSEADFHPVGTCRMGADSASVVDPQLRVRGVTGLRIAGAAVMPKVTSGNTNAPSMMIGDRCGQMIQKGA